MTSRRLWQIVVPVVAAAGATVMVEAALRLDHLRSDARFFIADAERGWALRPGQRGWSREENRVWVTINSAGYRDHERSVAKPPATFRVAVLGDSFMQAMNVPLEKTFTSYLEAGLGGCLHRQVEVLNFGVSGYGTAQQLITYRSHVAPYSPDVVLLAFYTDNDVHDNHPSTDDRVRSYFVLRDGRLVALTRREILRSLPLHHRLRLFLTDHLRTADTLYASWAQLRRAAVTGPDGSHDGDGGIYAPPHRADLIEAWRVTEALLLEFQREVSRRGSRFWLVTLANAAQVTPDVDRRAALAQAIGADSLFYPDRRLAAFAANNGIPVVTLAEPLAEFAARTGRYLHGGYNATHPAGSGHWNDTANALAAGIVATRMCQTR